MGGLRKLRRRNIDRYAVEALRSDLEPRAWKLSTRIMDLAKPLIDDVHNDLFEMVVALAVLCWNIALLPEDEQERELRSTAKMLTKGESAAFRRDVENWARMLIGRKKALFGDDRRVVADFQISVKGDSASLFVTSALVPD